MLKVLQAAILCAAIALVLSGALIIRREAAEGGSVTYAGLASNALNVLATVAVIAGYYSPLNLLWLFPLSSVAGFLALLPPFNWLLVPLGKVYGILCTIGVSTD